MIGEKVFFFLFLFLKGSFQQKRDILIKLNFFSPKHSNENVRKIFSKVT